MDCSVKTLKDLTMSAATGVLVLLVLFSSFAVHAGGLTKGFGLDSKVVKHEDDYTCTPKPSTPPPAQHSAAESLPPLPLPVVPQRRTEKKNPPRPPVLIAKIATGDRSDWATNPSDTKNLLRWMAKELEVNFSSINLPMSKLPSTPRKAPVLYRTGHNAFSFSKEVRKRLRSYLRQGGFLILDACCGRKEFVKSALREMNRLFPTREPYRLTFDHPVYRSYFDLGRDDIVYRKWARKAGAENGKPGLIGIDVECRTAVFFFRWDVSCGWDGLEDSKRHHCLGYTIPSSRKIGANLMAYITAERNAAMGLSKAKRFVNADKKSSDKIMIAQAKYHGTWKTREAALPMLLQTFHNQTDTPVSFNSEVIPLASEKLFQAPLVYMTGHHTFNMTAAEKANLRKYLRNGGILFAESCCGRQGFDRAFRHEIQEIFNGKELSRLPNSHPVFNLPNQIDGVQPRPPLAEALEKNGRIPPVLYGMKIDGNSGVIYSPYGLACGWELAQCPYCRGLVSEDALAVGVNVLMYATMY